MIKLLPLLVILTLFLSSCGRNMDSTVYSSSSTVGKVLEGTVINARPITIKDSDKLEKNALGGLAGGVAGGVGGNAIGKGHGNTAATVGGVIAGAVLGAVVQDQLSTSKGMEYVVRIDKKYANSIPTKTKKKQIKLGDNSIDADVKDSISVEDTKTDLISVIQGTDIIFQAGQRVLVIYNNDRPRLAPNY
ncbi:MAG: glycine zipper 2TM domain-containing protein [Alphaproteobacteria bacterium]|jgi:outer membrane lipoprotein SlyB